MAKINTDLTVKTHRLYLPSTANEPNEDDRVWLEVKDRLGLSDKVSLSEGSSTGDKLVSGLASFIVKWNFTEDGTENSPMIPITSELIDQQIKEPKDIEAVLEEYFKAVKTTKGVSDDEKKTLSDTSPLDKAESHLQI